MHSFAYITAFFLHKFDSDFLSFSLWPICSFSSCTLWSMFRIMRVWMGWRLLRLKVKNLAILQLTVDIITLLSTEIFFSYNLYFYDYQLKFVNFYAYWLIFLAVYGYHSTPLRPSIMISISFYLSYFTSEAAHRPKPTPPRKRSQ